jgi:hypothetical protein
MTLSSMLTAVTSAWGENPWAFGLVSLGVVGLLKLFMEDVYHESPPLEPHFPKKGGTK